MKLKIFAVATLLASSIAVCQATPQARQTPQTTPKTTQTESQWIEIGEVFLSGGVNQPQKPKPTLYAFMLGEKLLYKVIYNGSTYSVVPNPRYRKDSNWTSDYNAQITIDGYTWYLNVPNW